MVSYKKQAKKFFVTGDKEIDRLLSQLPRSLARKVLTKAIRKGMKPVLKTARATAPKDTGNLKKSTKLKMGKRSALAVRMNVISEATSPNGFFYPAVQNYGSEKRGIPATRWMSKTYEKHEESAKAEIRADIIAGLESTIREMRKG